MLSSLRWNGNVLGEVLQPAEPAQAAWTDCGANSGWQVDTVPEWQLPSTGGVGLVMTAREGAASIWCRVRPNPQSRPPQQSIRRAEAEKPELHPGQLWQTL